MAFKFAFSRLESALPLLHSSSSPVKANVLLRGHVHPVHAHAHARGLSSGSDTVTDPPPSKLRVAQCYRLLQLEPDSSKDLVRRQYVKLARKYHPDSPEGTGDVQKFQTIDEVGTR